MSTIPTPTPMTTAIQMPQKVKIQTDPKTPHTAKFILAPMERGYGHTIGNAYRRILLSSLHGYAVTAIKLPGVKHEFSSIEGITEDVLYIHLNLKKIGFRALNDVDSETITLSLKGKETFTGGDIKSPNFEVLNPEEIICHMDPSVELQVELIIQKGIGYIPSEEQTPPEGYLPLDAIFTPIINVNMEVDNARVGDKTDYDQLTLKVQTNGALTPQTAVQKATKILQDHFALFANTQTKLAAGHQKDKPKPIQANPKLQESLSTYKKEFSIRVYRALDKAGIHTLKDLVDLSQEDLANLRNFGQKSLDEINAFLNNQGLADMAKLTDSQK